MKLRCCVVDDEPLAGQLIASYVSRTPSLELGGVYTSAQDAFSIIAAGGIDLVFLDIQMPQLSGMEFARLIPGQTMVVFTTAFENYAVEGYKVDAVDYLLKPVNYEEFLGAVNRAMRRKESAMQATQPTAEGVSADAGNRNAEHLIVKTEYRLRQILKRDILFVEGLKDYVKIFVEGEDRSVMTLLSMKTLERSLPVERFMRVHRSFIVNLDKITMIERNHIIIGSHEIPVSDSYRASLSAYIASRSVVSD